MDSVEYHRATVLAGADDHPGATRRYYGSRGETPLQWGGSLADRLGLAGAVGDDGYDAVFGPGGAVDPHLGVRMVRTRRPGVELVVSAHKSVAVLGVLGAVDDMHAIVDAETDATMAFLDEWFRRQGGRRGRGQTRTATSGLLWARTRHLTSRAGDPEPHDHVLIANLTEMLDTAGGWKALDTGGLRDLVHAATMVGRHAAAERAVALGYAIEADPGPSGRLGHWRLIGVPDEVLELFSKRSADIDAAVTSEGFATYRSRGIAARRTRDPKADHHDPDLWHAWRDELVEAGIHPGELRRDFDDRQGHHRRPLQAMSGQDRAAVVEALLAADGPLADAKVFTRPDVIRAAAPLLYGYAHSELDRVVSGVIGHHDAVRLVGQPGARCRAWAVASTLATEEAIGHVAGHLANRLTGPVVGRQALALQVGAQEVTAGFALTTGQHQAVTAACTSARGLDVIVGVAGSGKTTALRVVHDAYRHAGYRVLGTAVSGQAARTLGTETGIESRTIASLVGRLDRGTLTLDDRTVLVVDEAGMTDDRALLGLLTDAHDTGAKAVLVGDHRQLGAIGPGGGLEALGLRHPEAVHVLDQNIRQRDTGERQALEHVRAGDVAEAVAWYRHAGRIAPSPTRADAITNAVAAWHADQAAGRESVLLAWRRASVAALNAAARQMRIGDGVITGPELTAPGGRGYASGDRVVMLAPGPDGTYVTSERATVEAVSSTGIAVRFDAGRCVTLAGSEIDAEHLDHAYALTVHRMQGATVERAHVLADGGGRELTYVALSRATDTTHVHVVADDVDQATEDLTREWSTEARQRWTLDTDTPATDDQPQRPGVARRPTPEDQAWQNEPEVDALQDTAASDQQAKIDQITRRLDAIQHRRPGPGRGLGIG
ncbi:MobF family relaxase [Iamia majanohamensis]|uniref:MobF family relaxase n=1 Tax=Iamia majanohamensis TaxID=467976 RepID=A0AAE9Y8C4_9ACTN|nr:MobF family relaxase [Iamia majanohamensis]WCO68719.1 MobF family relaxase [Iamia majanohamensis]